MGTRALLFILLYWTIAKGCPNYISYTLDFEWKDISAKGNPIQFDGSPLELQLPFTKQFDFFGTGYSSITLTNNGWLYFNPIASKPGVALVNGTGLPDATPTNFGDAILFFQTKMPSPPPANSYYVHVEGAAPRRIWILQASNLKPDLGGKSTNDKCNNDLTAQVRLYEDSNNIEIYILSGYLKSYFYDIYHWFGIQTNLESNNGKKPIGIASLPFLNFKSSWLKVEDTQVGNLTISPNYYSSRIECPFPIAFRYECRQCKADSDCNYPGTSSRCGAPQATCITRDPFNNTWCTHPHSTSNIPNKAQSAYKPQAWLNRPNGEQYSCPSFTSRNCCPFGPPTWTPADVKNCSMTRECLDTINNYLCQYCSPNPYGLMNDPTLPIPNTNSLFITRYVKDLIDGACGNVHADPTTGDCVADVFTSYPDLPIKWNTNSIPPLKDCSICDPLGTDWCDSNDTVAYDPDLNANIICHCKSGALGRVCDVDINECDTLSIDCLNGGSCVQGYLTGTWECLCPEDFTGQLCQNPNPCNTKPCGDQGACIPDVQSSNYSCKCYNGHLGKNCEYNCLGCINGACTPDVTPPTTICNCSLGWRGPNCNQPDPCYPNPCGQGLCYEKNNLQLCECAVGFEGPGCRYSDPCSVSNPCVNGRCKSTGGTLECECSPGFHGPICDQQINMCQTNPCGNGTCLSKLNGYSCVCPDRRSGYTECTGISGGINLLGHLNYVVQSIVILFLFFCVNL